MHESSRLADLTMELIGAKATAEFIREAWSLLSFEHKKALAENLAEKVTALVKNDFHTENLIRQHTHNAMSPLLTAELAARGDEVTAAIKRAVDKALGKEEVVERLVHDLLNDQRKTISRVLSDALNGIPVSK